MNRLTLILTFSLAAIFLQKTAAQEITVFQGGQEGHAIYRIPAIIDLPNGELLAFAEGRVNGSDDFGDVNLVMKRSSDQGKTWSGIQTLLDFDSLQAGNPAPVVDLLDPRYPQGVIYLFYNTGNNHEYDIRMNRGVREVWVMKSFDLGKTWQTGGTMRTHPVTPFSSKKENTRAGSTSLPITRSAIRRRISRNIRRMDSSPMTMGKASASRSPLTSPDPMSPSLLNFRQTG